MANLINGLGGAAGFGENILARNDDGSTALIDLRLIFGAQGLNFFGRNYTGLYVNNNGSITFGAPLTTYTPTAITGSTSNPIIAPFWADVDTRGGVVAPTPGGTSTGSNLVYYDLDAANRVFTATWDDVGYYNSRTNRLNAFQLQIAEIGTAGDFDISFRYEGIDWTTGDASSGVDGLGGVLARVGYSSGNGVNFLQLGQSGDQAGLLALESASNVGTAGLFRFTVRNGATTPAISIADATIVEGNAPNTNFASVAVFLAAPSSQTISVRYATRDGAAVAGTDYVGQAGILTFAPGITQQTIFVEINADSAIEADEAFAITLSDPVNAPIAQATGSVTIVNDDGFVISDVRQFEGTGTATTPFVFTVSIGSALSTAVEVDYALEVSAAVASEVSLTSGRLRFEPGQTSRTITANVVADSFAQADDTFIVRLNNPVGLGIADATATGTILNDDGFVIDDVTVTEGTATTTGTATVTVRLLSAQATAATVNWATAPGSATAPADYTTSSGSLSFAAGELSRTLTVPIVRDSLVEATESFLVRLSGGGLTSIIDAEATVSILDDDGFSISDALVVEDDTGTTSLQFTVSLGSALPTASSVTFATANGTAGDPVDYSSVTTTLTFDAGVTSRTVQVLVYGDRTPEADETILASLSNPIGAAIVRGTATGTIFNDDGVSALDRSIAEGAAGPTLFVFVPVQLSAPATSTVTVAFTTQDGTATAGSDYIATSGTVVFAPGIVEQSVPVGIIGNAIFEGDETFRLVLSSPVNSVLVDASATVTITNDDAPPLPSLRITDAAITEGTGAGTTVLRFQVALSQVLASATSVNFATTAGSATAGADFTARTGTLTIPAGSQFGFVEIPIVRDTAREDDETFLVTLSGPTAGVTIAGEPAKGTILNDDLPPVISIAAANADRAEGGVGAVTPFTFLVSRTGDLAATTINARVSPNGANPANAADFVGAIGTPVAINFAAGEASRTFTVNVAGDAASEADEGFIVELRDPAPGVSIGTASASGIIRNDDSAAIRSFSIAATAADRPEGNTGVLTPYVFTITRTGDLAAASVSVTLTGSGTNPAVIGDFAGGFGAPVVFAFAAGETSRTVTVTVTGDTVVEPDEGFTVTLSAPSAGSDIPAAGAAATGVIRNDDVPPGFAVVAINTDRTEGATGTATPFTFLVTRTDATAAAGVDITLTGTGANPATIGDFVGGFGAPVRLSFAPGEGSRAVTVTVAGDNAVEAAEGFVVTLSNPSTGIIVTPTATGVIRNDDAPMSFAIAATAADRPEGGPGVATPYLFTITRGGDLAAASIDVTLTGAGANAASIGDFVGGFGAPVAFAFAAGEVSRTVTVTVAGDAAGELDEGFAVTLSNAPSGATIVNAAASGIIRNDDAGGGLSFAVTAVNADRPEGALGTATGYTFSVSREGQFLGQAATVNVTLTGAGANPAVIGDFVGGFGAPVQLTFAPNVASQTVTVTVAGDGVFEPDEGFVLTLTDPSLGFIQTATASGVIRNDDPGLFSVAGIVTDQNEGGPGAFTGYTYTVSRTGNIAAAASVSIALTGSGADAAVIGDFVGGFGTPVVLNFAAGEASRLVTVNVAGDTIVEADETFVVTLSAPSANMQLGTATAEGTIRNDDNNPFTGTAGNDVITGTGLGDPIFALGGDDSIAGLGGADTIDAGPGNDVINGGRGPDTMTGGTGNDVFVLARNAVLGDWITDFLGNGNAAGDSLQLIGWGAGTIVTAVAGQPEIYAITDGGDGFVETIRITGPLVAADIVFG